MYLNKEVYEEIRKRIEGRGKQVYGKFLEIETTEDNTIKIKMLIDSGMEELEILEDRKVKVSTIFMRCNQERLREILANMSKIL